MDEITAQLIDGEDQNLKELARDSSREILATRLFLTLNAIEIDLLRKKN